MWREYAACLTEDPELFFPDGSGPAAVVQMEEATLVCARCPVLDRCRQWALTVNLQYGVCGGTTPDERALLQGLHRQGRWDEQAPVAPVFIGRQVN